MEIGNEISQKIRSAIKAKLVDLGAYVDDELPDYIMVMVANKKSQQQMTADLNLFLGDNTEKFTAWLHSLLSKLKSIATDPAKDAAASKVVGAKVVEETKTVKLGAKESTTETEEPELTLRPDKDEFEEEQMLSESKSKSSGSIAGSSSSSHQRAAAKPSRAPRARRPAVLAKQASDPDKEKEQDKAPAYESESRKRKMPGSVVTAVPQPPEEPEEEYDPTKPMIGRVASTVKVGERRPTVPPSRQASKALVMKAMTEAKESVESSANRQKQVERVRPLQQRLGPDSEYQPPRGRGRGVSHRLTTSSAREELHLSSHYQSSARGPASRMRSAAMPPPRRLSKPDPPVQVESERSVSLLSSSRREEELQRLRWEAEEAEAAKREAQMRQIEHAVAEVVVKRESPEMDWAAEAEQEEKELIETSASEVEYHPTPIQDSRQVTCDDPKPEEVIQEQRTISVKPRISETSTPSQDAEMLIESGVDEELCDRRLVQESTPIKENPPSPKFVVTLDGAEGMGGEQDISDVFMDEEESPGPRNIVRVKPLFSATDRPMYSDDIDDGDMIPMKTKRLPERCRFWPACMKADTCPFHHPTEPCKNFPNCKFGSKCLYLHPTCKFDGRCTRPECPYTHTVKPQTPSRMPVMLQAVGVLPVQSPIEPTGFMEPSAAHKSSQVPCRFFPNCTNMSCPFLHPKACRYGAACRNQPHCVFSHPPLPTKDQMKWTASSQPSATSTSSTTTTSPS